MTLNKYFLVKPKEEGEKGEGGPHLWLPGAFNEHGTWGRMVRDQPANTGLGAGEEFSLKGFFLFLTIVAVFSTWKLKFCGYFSKEVI